MTWTAKFNVDPGDDKYGIAYAVWNEGQADEFRFSRRLEIANIDINAFATKALAIQGDKGTKDKSQSDIGKLIETALKNGGK